MCGRFKRCAEYPTSGHGGFIVESPMLGELKAGEKKPSKIPVEGVMAVLHRESCCA